MNRNPETGLGSPGARLGQLVWQPQGAGLALGDARAFSFDRKHQQSSGGLSLCGSAQVGEKILLIASGLLCPRACVVKANWIQRLNQQKGARDGSMGRTVFSINSAGKTQYLHAEGSCHLHIPPKLAPNGSKDLNRKTKTVKL